MEDFSDTFILSSPVESVGLPVRVSNILRMHHIMTVGGLLEHRRGELYCLPGFGEGCRRAVDAFLADHGLAMCGD